MITHSEIRETEVERDEILERMVCRQACRSYNAEGRELSTSKERLLISCIWLGGISSMAAALWIWR